MNFNGFKEFTEIYHKQIEKIHLSIDSNFNNYLVELSRFERFEALHICIRVLKLDLVIDKELILNGLNYKHLKYLGLIIPYSVPFSKDENICGLFSGYIGLEKLIIRSDEMKMTDPKIFSKVESLKCEKLKCLAIDFLMCANPLEDINLYLPNLKTLVIQLTENFKTDSEILQSLAKTKNLMKLIVSIREMTDSIVSNVMEISYNVIEIYFDANSIKITRNTFELLYQRSKSDNKFEFQLNSKSKANEFFDSKYVDYKKYYSLYLKKW